MRVTIAVEKADENEKKRQEVWIFWFRATHTRIEGVLDEYSDQERPSNRHKWRNKGLWSRLSRRTSSLEKPSVPAAIATRAKSEFFKMVEVEGL